MDLELRGRTALVCGASKGLGFAIAECLAEEGAFVGLLARNASTLAAAAERIKAKGGKAMPLEGDMGNWASIETALTKLRSAAGDPDILILNSGGPPAVDVARINAERVPAARLLSAAILLRAAALAVAATPELNGWWEDGRFRAADGVHVGWAVALRGGGLIAPAIRDADRLALDPLLLAGLALVFVIVDHAEPVF